LISAPLNAKLNGCGTHMERIVSVHDLFSTAARLPRYLRVKRGRADVDPQASRAAALYP
jgi:hypothetical protein